MKHFQNLIKCSKNDSDSTSFQLDTGLDGGESFPLTLFGGSVLLLIWYSDYVADIVSELGLLFCAGFSVGISDCFTRLELFRISF